MGSLNALDAPAADLEAEAARYVSEELGVASAADALQGASDILAEEVSEKADLRRYLRDYLMSEGVFTSRTREEYPEGTANFEMYRDYRVRVKDIAPHNMLALRRGETEGILIFTIEFDLAVVLSFLESKEIHARAAFPNSKSRAAIPRYSHWSIQTFSKNRRTLSDRRHRCACSCPRQKVRMILALSVQRKPASTL